jgi:peroxiredoxin
MRWAAVILPLVLLAATAAPPGVGKPAPQFTLMLFDGRQVALKELVGKPVVINFWHSG